MDSAEFLAEGLVRGKLIVVDGCPGVVPRPWGGFVRGELYRVNEAQLGELGDREVRVEGELQAKEDFQRVLLDAYPHNLGQKPLRAWCWKWTGPEVGYPVVGSGDWPDRLMSPPWCTWIAFVCLLFLPVGYLAANRVTKVFGLTFGILCFGFALLSPFVGLMAAQLANRRRESYKDMRGILVPLLFISSIPALIQILSIMGKILG